MGKGGDGQSVSLVQFSIKGAEIKQVLVAQIDPNPDQPRQLFMEPELGALAASIAENQDIINPVIVVRNNGRFMLVDGERRWRSAKKAGIKAITALILAKTPSKDQIFLMSAIANFCRQEMTIAEKAFAIKHLQEKFGWSQGLIARKLGLTQASVSNILKFFSLHEEIKVLLACGKLKPGIAFQLAGYPLESQLALLAACNEESARLGKELHPNEAALFLRQVARKKGVSANNKKKRKTTLKIIVAALTRLTHSLSDFLDRLESEIAESQNTEEVQELKDSLSRAFSQLKRALEFMN